MTGGGLTCIIFKTPLIYTNSRLKRGLVGEIPSGNWRRGGPLRAPSPRSPSERYPVGIGDSIATRVLEAHYLPSERYPVGIGDFNTLSLSLCLFTSRRDTQWELATSSNAAFSAITFLRRRDTQWELATLLFLRTVFSQSWSERYPVGIGDFYIRWNHNLTVFLGRRDTQWELATQPTTRNRNRKKWSERYPVGIGDLPGHFQKYSTDDVDEIPNGNWRLVFLSDLSLLTTFWSTRYPMGIGGFTADSSTSHQKSERYPMGMETSGSS